MISFKPLQSSDFTLLNTWMNIDFVSRWYEKRKAVYDNVEKKYKTKTPETVPVDSFLIMHNDMPIGYIQRYFIARYPAYAEALAMDIGVVGIDMFIGERDFLYKGYGRQAVELFLQQQVFSLPGVNACIVALEPSHTAAKRMYEKAGFSYLQSAALNGVDEEEIYIKRKKTDTILYAGTSVAGGDTI